MRDKDDERAKARDWLSRYVELEEDAKREKDRAKALKDKAFSISSSKLSNAPKNKNIRNAVEESVVEFMTAYEKSMELSLESEKARMEILDVINSLDNVNHRRALKHRYVDNLWEYEIARIMGYTDKYIRNLLSRAVKDVTHCDTYLRYTVE